MTRRAAGPGATRRTEVGPERIAGWCARFAAAHGALSWHHDGDTVTLEAADGASAVLEVPFPPFAPDEAAPDHGLADHAGRERLVGLLLVRKGGYAAGVFAGRRLLASKVGSRHVQGRAAAGGWSQQRFARRREQQAREAYGAAADVAVRVLLEYADRLDAVVTGGDRPALGAVLGDARLSGVRGRVVDRVLEVADPRQHVLEAAIGAAYAVRITVHDPL